MIRATIALLLSLIALITFSQKKLVLKFEHEAQTQVPDKKELFCFYYIVDSTISFHRGSLTFYAFTLSEDSARQSGFIAYDTNSGDVVFQKDSLKGKKPIKLFRLKSKGITEVKDIPDLYRFLDKTVQKNYIIFTVSRRDAFDRKTSKISPSFKCDSHGIYLKRVSFEKGNSYPESMTFFFPFDDESLLILKPITAKE